MARAEKFIKPKARADNCQMKNKAYTKHFFFLNKASLLASVVP